MNNILAQLLVEDDEFILNFNNNNNLIAYVVENNLAVPLEPPLPGGRRNPGRNQNYVEQTIPLYTPDEFRNHFRMSRNTFEVGT